VRLSAIATPVVLAVAMVLLCAFASSVSSTRREG
jgi:hypothetical protein